MSPLACVSVLSDLSFIFCSPLFVTWHIKEDDDYQLRGCIGTFSAQPLADGLKEYAAISAFKDSRFSPISQKELPLLKCSISLLTDFEDAETHLDWVVGTHGISIQFTDTTVKPAKKFNATYLPEVAAEQGWDQLETLTSLIRKAGFRKTLDDVLAFDNLKVTRYQSQKCALTYEVFFFLFLCHIKVCCVVVVVAVR